jgi:hypothetical protein
VLTADEVLAQLRQALEDYEDAHLLLSQDERESARREILVNCTQDIVRVILPESPADWRSLRHWVNSERQLSELLETCVTKAVVVDDWEIVDAVAATQHLLIHEVAAVCRECLPSILDDWPENCP